MMNRRCAIQNDCGAPSDAALLLWQSVKHPVGLPTQFQSSDRKFTGPPR